MPSTLLSLTAPSRTRTVYPYPPMATPASPRVIFLDALFSYRKQTKIDISQHALLPKLQNCNTPDMIVNVLRTSKARPFFRSDEGSPPWLATTVDVLHAFSFTLGRHVGMVNITQAHIPSPSCLTPIYSYSHPRMLFLLPLVFSSKSVSSSISARYRYDAQIFQAVVGQEGLSEFFLRMQTFFQQLKSYTEISLEDEMKNRIVGYLAEVLSALAILTKHIKQRRLSEFILGDISYSTHLVYSANYRKIITPLLEARPLGSSERRPSKSSDDKERSIQTAVNKLDKLIQDEARLPRPVAPQQPRSGDMDEKRSYSLVSPTLPLKGQTFTQDTFCYDMSSRGSLHPISCKSTPCARLMREQQSGSSKSMPTNDGRPMVPCCGSVECVCTFHTLIV